MRGRRWKGRRDRRRERKKKGVGGEKEEE